MKIFKRILSITMVFAMCLTMFVGCKGKDDSKTETDNNAQTDTETKKTVVGVSLLTKEHVFYNNIETALKNKADELGVEVIIQDASMDASKQLNQVQDFVTQKVDAIILAPTNSAGSKSMVELAKNANIPVFTMDIASDGETVAHVATDNYTGGQLAAEYMVNNMLADKKGEVSIVTYSEVESCVDREKGFSEWMKANAPDVKIVDVQNCSGDQGKAAEVTQNMLTKYPDLKAIFAVGDPFAMGALSSIKAANSDVKIIGFDGNPEGIDEIKKGENWIADIAQNPTAIGEKTLEAVMDYLGGKTVEKLIPISPKVIDKDNM